MCSITPPLIRSEGGVLLSGIGTLGKENTGYIHGLETEPSLEAAFVGPLTVDFAQSKYRFDFYKPSGL